MVDLSRVLAGPIVRRVDPESVSIWLALDHAAVVALRVEDDAGAALLVGEAETVAIGAELHAVLVTAKGKGPLDWGHRYLYELSIDGELLDLATLLYDGGPEKLSIVLPAATLAETRIVHGSCRHPTNHGKDALGILDEMIADSFVGGGRRPELFVCSGDLIYADSPSPSLLALAGTLGDRMLGYTEVLPQVGCAASQIPPGERQEVAGAMAQVYDPPERQLFGFGEYLALHLLALSPTLWPIEPPDDLRRFHSTLGQVRRALANTAFYAVFDDHEIIDDWYLTRAWAERVLSAPLGRRMIANGLSAFAVVHAWGNTPEHFADGEVGHRILRSLSRQAGPDEELERDLGMPTEVGAHLSPPPGSLPWHFRLQTPVVDLRTLDTRTMRAFPSDDEHGLPDLLSEKALEQQLSDFNGRLPVLVVPSPMAPPPRTRSERFFVSLASRWRGESREVREVYGPDRGDDWQPSSEFFQSVLDRLPNSWVCLGGDTHLAYAAEVEQDGGVGAIFCSSGMQRETAMRLMRQRVGFAYPWPIRRHPRVSTASMQMRYLQSEKTPEGIRYQYLSRNNIGALHFEGDEAGLRAVHTLWWRRGNDDLSAVMHRIALAKP